MDTLAVQAEVDRPSWNRIAAKLRQRSSRKPDGTESLKAYGSFELSRATLYAGNSGFRTTCRVVLEFCPGKVMRGHNLFASELCAREALGFVLDELEGRTGVALAGYDFMVCRLDAAYTFIGRDAAPYLAEAAGFSLPRRSRVVYEHGVAFNAKCRAELLYDKRVEVDRAVQIADRTSASEPSGLKTLRHEGTIEAARIVANGALRVECRIKGSPSVARLLHLPDARFATVVTDESSYKLLSGFLAQFAFTSGPAIAGDIAKLRLAGHSGSRLLQLIGFRELENIVGGDREAYRALGMSPARRRLLRRELHLSGAHGLGRPSLAPLVVTREDITQIRKMDEGELTGWQARRMVWRNYWQLSQHEPGLLAA